jgi:hypothetical protein
MRLLVLGSCALFLTLPGYGQNDLKIDLLTHAPEAQVVHHLLSLSEKTHEPSGLTVTFFANDLTKAMAQRQLRNADVTPLVNEIDAIFKSAGTSTVGFLDHIAAFKTAMISLGVSAGDAAKASRELEAIGRQVRGPEDTPVDPIIRRQFR